MSAGSNKGQKLLAVDVEHAVSFISFCSDQRVRLTRQAKEAPVAIRLVMSGDEGQNCRPGDPGREPATSCRVSERPPTTPSHTARLIATPPFRAGPVAGFTRGNAS